MSMKRAFLAASLSLIIVLMLPVAALAQKSSLPEFGDASVVSLNQEYYLGRAWLMSFRRQVPTVSDPIIYDYFESLIYRLLAESEVKDRRLELVVVDSRTINAFAVPGGIVGVHNGLILAAETEAQFASVLAHELAHLSQRHFARGVESRQNAATPSLAGLLAGMVMIVAGSGDAGMATIAGTQAAIQQNQLRFSRNNEQEADRLGMQNMVNAGLDPNGAAGMFTIMQGQSRRSKPPEFLLTHPLTETRIADARSRARNYPRKIYEDNPEYRLVRARVQLSFRNTKEEAVLHFKKRVDEGGRDAVASQYGLVLALTDVGRFDEAREYLKPMREFAPRNMLYGIAEAEIEIGSENFAAALDMLERGISLVPGNHPITMTLVKALHKSGDNRGAAKVLTEHAKAHPHDPHVWYVLAEIEGLAGNTLAVHRARAEYFVYTGQLQQAQRQLAYALPLATDQVMVERINGRIEHIRMIQQALKQMK